MYLKCNRRWKNGKEHCYWSIVEALRCRGGRVVQRPVLYLGEINDSQREAWIESIEAFDQDSGQQTRLTLFAEDRALAAERAGAVGIRLKEFVLQRPRQWGGCWLFSQLWVRLGLDGFWRERLGTSREGTRWEEVLAILTAYRLLDPGSEWRLHRQWYDHSAMADLLDAEGRRPAKETFYRCLDLLVEHKAALFDHLTGRWRDLFGAKFEVLLYDLTSTYFESDPPFPEEDKRRHGYSRDKRSDCVQVVIALVVTPEGFPLAYEVMAGNTSDKTTLPGFLQKIQTQYGKAERIWVMDRGIPTEKVLAQMRQSNPPVSYLVGTPKGRLNRLEAQLTRQPWAHVRDGIDVKLLPEKQELYVFAQSRDRIGKERAMRRRQLKGLLKRLQELQKMKLTAQALLLKLGEAKGRYRAAWRLVEFDLPAASRSKTTVSFAFKLNRAKLREARRRAGRYLLRTNLTAHDPAQLWEFYTQLTQVEEAFKNLKGDLAIRPIFHQLEGRIEAHIMVSFLAYCLHVTLRHQLRRKAPGLTPRAVLEKFSTLQMLDAWFPTTDGRWLIFARYTQPQKDHLLLLAQLDLQLPPQAPPRITAQGNLAPP